MSKETIQPIEVTGYVQNYDWGKPSTLSTVFQLAHANTPSHIINDDSNQYAELWYGTHINGPSYTIPQSGNKSSYTPQDGQLLTHHLNGATLPFILKVLSINQALSLQAHPDKSLAEQLHQEYPQHYKDSNHKPELVIALKPTRALCGFQTIDHVIGLMDAIPEFKQLLEPGKPIIDVYLQSSRGAADEQSAIRQLFEIAMTSSVTTVESLLSSFVTRCASFKGIYQKQLAQDATFVAPPSEQDLPHIIHTTPDDYIALMYSLIEQYGTRDMGVFGAAFLYYFTLLPNQSVFLGPNIPHAYLFGEVIEAMACSDNVVRAGLTGKFRDVQTLIEMLTFETYTPAITAGQRTPSHPSSTQAESTDYTATHTLYAPPYPEFPEFAVIQTTIKPGPDNDTGNEASQSSPSSSYPLPRLNEDSIVLCTQSITGSTLVISTDTCEKESEFLVHDGFGVYIPAHARASIRVPPRHDAPSNHDHKQKHNITFYRCSANLDPTTIDFS